LLEQVLQSALQVHQGRLQSEHTKTNLRGKPITTDHCKW
jgi:hypothetical protein